MSKYSVNEHYFDSIDTEEKSYFLGLIASDGCVTEENKMLLSLQERDSFILDRLKNNLGYNGPIYHLKPVKQTHQPQRRLQIRNKILCRSLNTLGIFPRKSLNMKFPDDGIISDHLIHHFIRGYFDGDGCIRISKDVLMYKMVGTKEFLERVQNILIDRCSLPKTKLFQANPDKNTYELCYSGDKQCIRIYGFLYEDATLYLPRKKEKVRIQISERLKLYNSWTLREELSERT